jgi:serine/threonine protein kinase
MPLASGVRLGPYEILSLVAAGGMGEVYRAHDSRLGRIVAIKVVGSNLGSDPDMRRRFDAEARLAAQLDHPRIGAIHDVGHDGGVDYLVMEFIEGQSLADRIAAGPLPFSDLIGVHRGGHPFAGDRDRRQHRLRELERRCCRHGSGCSYGAFG